MYWLNSPNAHEPLVEASWKVPTDGSSLRRVKNQEWKRLQESVLDSRSADLIGLANAEGYSRPTQAPESSLNCPTLPPSTCRRLPYLGPRVSQDQPLAHSPPPEVGHRVPSFSVAPNLKAGVSVRPYLAPRCRDRSLPEVPGEQRSRGSFRSLRSGLVGWEFWSCPKGGSPDTTDRS